LKTPQLTPCYSEPTSSDLSFRKMRTDIFHARKSLVRFPHVLHSCAGRSSQELSPLSSVTCSRLHLSATDTNLSFLPFRDSPLLHQDPDVSFSLFSEMSPHNRLSSLILRHVQLLPLPLDLFYQRTTTTHQCWEVPRQLTALSCCQIFSLPTLLDRFVLFVADSTLPRPLTLLGICPAELGPVSQIVASRLAPRRVLARLPIPPPCQLPRCICRVLR